MSFLFGHLYETPCKFTHDQAMFRKKGRGTGGASVSEFKLPGHHKEQPAGSDANYEREARSSSPDGSFQHRPDAKTPHAPSRGPSELAHDHDKNHPTKKRRRSDDPSESEHAMPSIQAERSAANIFARSSASLQLSSAAPYGDSPPLSSYEHSEAWKQQAFDAARGAGSSDWNDITLVSVSGHQEREQEL